MLRLCHSQKNWMQDPFNKTQQRNTRSLFWTFISPVTRPAKHNPDQFISAGYPRSSLLEQSPPDSILDRTSPSWLDREALVMWSESGSQDPREATGGNPCEPALNAQKHNQKLCFDIFSCLCVPSTWLDILDGYRKIKDCPSLQRVPIWEKIKTSWLLKTCFSLHFHTLWKPLLSPSGFRGTASAGHNGMKRSFYLKRLGTDTPSLLTVILRLPWWYSG